MMRGWFCRRENIRLLNKYILRYAIRQLSAMQSEKSVKYITLPRSDFSLNLHYSIQKWIIEKNNEISISWMNLLACKWGKRTNGFDCNLSLTVGENHSSVHLTGAIFCNISSRIVQLRKGRKSGTFEGSVQSVFILQFSSYMFISC